jgi:hypothetical protein
MAAFSGTAGSVLYMNGGTAVVEGIGEWSVDVQGEAVETTAFGVNWRENIVGIRSYTISFSGRRDGAAGQELLHTGILAGSIHAFRLHENATKYWNVGSAVFTGMNPSLSFDGRGDTSYEFTGSGALTYV